MDKANTQELLTFILTSLSLIKRRFSNIKNSDDFLDNDEGLDKLDAISMRLQAIGETIKNISKRDPEFLVQVASKTYWKEVIRARDFLSHHYIDIDSEIVFDICDNEIIELESYIIELSNLV